MFNWPEFATGIFGGSVSSLVVVYGLSRWLGDVWKSRILEKVQQENRRGLEAMKSEMQASVDRANRLLEAGISKAILVTRTHFETEFVAYKEIFSSLSDVTIRTISMLHVLCSLLGVKLSGLRMKPTWSL
jgi:hypothetical protein